MQTTCSFACPGVGDVTGCGSGDVGNTAWKKGDGGVVRCGMISDEQFGGVVGLGGVVARGVGERRDAAEASGCGGV